MLKELLWGNGASASAGCCERRRWSACLDTRKACSVLEVVCMSTDARFVTFVSEYRGAVYAGQDATLVRLNNVTIN